MAVRSSMGCGRWALVPWIVVAPPEQSLQHGIIVQFLFRADGSGVYLCLGLSTSKLRQIFGPESAKRYMRQVAGLIRTVTATTCGGLLGAEAGFDVEG